VEMPIRLNASDEVCQFLGLRLNSYLILKIRANALCQLKNVCRCGSDTEVSSENRV